MKVGPEIESGKSVTEPVEAAADFLYELLQSDEEAEREFGVCSRNRRG